MYDVKSGNIDAVRQIYRLESDLDLANKDGKTSIDLAVDHGFNDIYIFLRENNKSSNTEQIATNLECSMTFTNYIHIFAFYI